MKCANDRWVDNGGQKSRGDRRTGGGAKVQLRLEFRAREAGDRVVHCVL